MKLFNKTKMTAVTLITSITVLFSTSASVCAATTDTKEGKLPVPSAETQSNNVIMPLGSNTLYLGGSNAFTSVPVSFGAAGGVFAVSVPHFIPGSYRMDIMMWGRNGLLWQEEDCLGYSIGRGFQCGRDVTRISLRIVSRGSTSTRVFAVNVSW